MTTVPGPILVTGAGGQLGGAVVEHFTGLDLEVHGLDRAALDVTDARACRRAVNDISPGVIVNCAAYTKVDLAEEEEELAAAINTSGAANMARAGAEAEALVIHFSTDFVFDGSSDRPYTEDDPPAPINAYGRTKWTGETAVRKAGGRHLILRTAWLYGPHGPNFVKTILRLAGERSELTVVDDQIGSPTCTLDIAAALPRIIDLGVTGTFNLVNSGRASWFDFAARIIDLTGLEVKIRPIKSSQLDRPAPRPAMSVLSTARLIGLGLETRPWQDALADYLDREGLLPPAADA